MTDPAPFTGVLLRRRLAVLAVGGLLALTGAACGDDDDGRLGETPSGVGEPGNEESETGGGGAPAEGVEDQNEEN